MLTGPTRPHGLLKAALPGAPKLDTRQLHEPLLHEPLLDAPLLDAPLPSGRHAVQQRRRPRRALALASVGLTLLAAALAGSCAPEAPATPETTPLPEARTTIEGDWWVLAPSLPTHALRLTLVPSEDDPGASWDGSWRSFDWRGTDQPHLLARSSHPVSVSARRNRARQLEIHGPVPQIDAFGRPTGREGDWHLVVDQVSLAGQPLRFTGTLSLDSQMPVAAELTTSFRAWTP